MLVVSSLVGLENNKLTWAETCSWINKVKPPSHSLFAKRSTHLIYNRNDTLLSSNLAPTTCEFVAPSKDMYWGHYA